jgi:hypothetical protein
MLRDPKPGLDPAIRSRAGGKVAILFSETAVDAGVDLLRLPHRLCLAVTIHADVPSQSRQCRIGSRPSVDESAARDDENASARRNEVHAFCLTSHGYSNIDNG